MKTLSTDRLSFIILIGMIIHLGFSSCTTYSSNKTELVLRTEFMIPNEEETDEYLFIRPVDLDVDVHGNIYVLDSGDCQIKVFDSQGQYAYAFGSQGQGPGEFQSPLSINITESNEVMVYDMRMRKISFFSLSGDFKNQINVPAILSMLSLQLSKENDPYAKLVEMDRYSIAKISKDFSSFEKIVEIQYGDEPDHLLRPDLYFCLANNLLVCGYSDKYELKIMDFYGNVVKTIQNKHSPVRFSEELKEQVIEMVWPKGIPEWRNVVEQKHCPAFMNLSADDDGRIYVGTFQRPKNKPRSFYFDVYDTKGKYITKFPLDRYDYRKKLIWKDNNLYFIDINDEGLYFIKKLNALWSH